MENSATVKPVIWRCLGAGLLFFGVLWIIGGLFHLPTHSTVALDINESRAVESRSLHDLDRASQAVDAVIALQPLQWRGYFQRAQIELSRGGDRFEVEQDFRRARFVEPNLEMIAYEEGLVWLPYDVKRAVSAWRDALNRTVGSRSRLIEAILRKAYRNDALMAGLIELSQAYPDFRARLILYLRGDALSRELEQELLSDPSLGKFTIQQRTAIVKHWIGFGEIDDVEAYLQAFGDTLDSPWFMFAQLRFKQARLEEAVGLGIALIRYYLERAEYREALRVIDALLQLSEPPAYVYYWRAEILYQLEDYPGSWSAFDAYWKQIK